MEMLDSSASSSIDWAGYDRGNRVLHVRFVGNDTEYEYLSVTPGEWTRLKKAESKGKFINFYIKPSHELGNQE